MKVSLTVSTIEQILPHREPVLLVREADGEVRDHELELCSRYSVPDSAPVLTGHFPEKPIWPGAYTIEGLAQACGVWIGAQRLVDAARQQGLRSVDESSAKALAGRDRFAQPVLLAKADVRLLDLVLPGAQLEYRVRPTHAHAHMLRFRVEASADRSLAARGHLVLARHGLGSEMRR